MISKNLIDKVSDLNKRLKNRKNVSKLNRKKVRDLIKKNEIGEIKFYERFSVDKLKEFKQDGCICVVDGSVNSCLLYTSPSPRDS